MLVTVIFYSHRNIYDLLEATAQYFETEILENYSNVIWLLDAHIKIKDRMVKVNISNMESQQWDLVLKDYLLSLFENEALFITVNNRDEYFDAFTNKSTLEFLVPVR